MNTDFKKINYNDIISSGYFQTLVKGLELCLVPLYTNSCPSTTTWIIL